MAVEACVQLVSLEDKNVKDLGKQSGMTTWSYESLHGPHRRIEGIKVQ